jgi:hypothetical protein
MWKQCVPEYKRKYYIGLATWKEWMATRYHTERYMATSRAREAEKTKKDVDGQRERKLGQEESQYQNCNRIGKRQNKMEVSCANESSAQQTEWREK